MKRNRIARLAVAIWIGWAGWMGPARADVANADASIAPARPSWVIERAEYTGQIDGQIARIHGSLKIRVLGRDGAEFRIDFPGAVVTRVDVPGSSGAHLLPDPSGGYRFIASRKGSYPLTVELSTRLVRDGANEGVAFGLPEAAFSTLTLDVPDRKLALRESDALYAERVEGAPTGRARIRAALASRSQVDLAWHLETAAPTPVEPIVHGDVATLVSLEDQLARLQAIIDYRVIPGSMRQLSVRVPADVRVLAVRGALIDEWRVTEMPGTDGTPGAQRLDVTLTSPIPPSGYRLAIDAEHAIPSAESAALASRLASAQGTPSAQGSASPQPGYTVPEISLIGVKQERGHVAIASEGNVEVSPATVDGATRIDVRELPETLRSSPAAPVLLAFRYYQHPYALALGVVRHKDRAVLNAIAEQAELATVVSRQGERLTRAAYAIRANKRQFLGVALPESATLWSCIVASRSVKPVDGEHGQLLVPLAGGEADRPVLVELVYFEQRPQTGTVGQLSLQGPMLDVPTTVANWLLYAPAEMRLLRTSGNLDIGAALSGYLDEPMAFAAEPAPLPASVSAQSESSAIFCRRELSARAAKRAMVTDEWKGDHPAMNAQAAPAMQSIDDRSDGYEAGKLKELDALVGSMAARMQEAGVLPLKIRLPNSGRVHRFHRLMTTQEPLRIDATVLLLPRPLAAASGHIAGWLGMFVAACAAVALWRTGRLRFGAAQ